MSDTDELKPCPFCGKTAKIRRYSIPFDAGPSPVVAYCDCGAFLNAHRWNNRPIETALKDQIIEQEVRVQGAKMVGESLVRERKERSCYQNTLILISTLIDNETEIGKIIEDALNCWTQRSIDPVRYWINKYKNAESNIKDLKLQIEQLTFDLETYRYALASAKEAEE